MCGEFNIDLFKYDRASNTKYFIDHFLSIALYPLINKPTHIKHGCHTIIDNIFTNVFHKDLCSGAIIDDTSVHFPIFCCANFLIKNDNDSSHKLCRKNYDEALNNFNYVLELENSNPAYNSSNADDAFDNFVDIFVNYYNRCRPLRNLQYQSKVHIKCGLQMD